RQCGRQKPQRAMRPTRAMQRRRARLARSVSSWLAFLSVLGEGEVLELRRTGVRLEDAVVLILRAIPVAGAQGPLRIAQLLVGLPHVPRLDECWRIVHPHIRGERLVVGLLPDLHGLYLIR